MRYSHAQDFHYFHAQVKQIRRKQRLAESADILEDILHEHVHVQHLSSLAALVVKEEDAARAQKQAEHEQWERAHPGLAYAARNRRRWARYLEQ
jgi:hypothetical protein